MDDFVDCDNVNYKLEYLQKKVEELEKRLRHRGTENTQVINLRLMNAQKELLRKNDFDFLIYNDDIEKAYQRLKDITHKILNG
jgi:guanylate kinase